MPTAKNLPKSIRHNGLGFFNLKQLLATLENAQRTTLSVTWGIMNKQSVGFGRTRLRHNTKQSGRNTLDFIVLARFSHHACPQQAEDWQGASVTAVLAATLSDFMELL